MKKYTTKSYLNNINKYIFYHHSTKEKHIVIKKILETDPFIVTEDGIDLKILDNNYYVMEIIPINSNYMCRIHLDYDKNIIERYYIMSLKNEIIGHIPVYEDLKTSYVIHDFKRKKYREEFIDELLKSNEISKKQYDKIKEEYRSLISEINDGKNEIYNMNYKKIIERIEGV